MAGLGSKGASISKRQRSKTQMMRIEEKDILALLLNKLYPLDWILVFI